MSWPTLSAFSPNNFLDHFPGSSLDATKWASVTSGTGAVSVTDSYADLVAPANSAAFVYYKTKLDKTKSQLWTICLSQQSVGGSGNKGGIKILNGSGNPIADTGANIDARSLIECDWINSPRVGYGVYYFDTSAVNTYYNDSTKAWTTTYPGTDFVFVRGQNDDYYVVGLEIDGVNSRWRMIGYGRAFDTAGTFQWPHGLTAYTLTDWVTWSVTRSSADIWLCIGALANNNPSAQEARVEWVRYAESVGNSALESWASPSDDLVFTNPHKIRHYYSYDGQTFLPEDRTTFALTNGAGGTPDSRYLQDPWAVYDGVGTDYLFYRGNTTTNVDSICVASATHAVPQTGPWTKYGSNPIIAVGASGQNDDKQVGFPVVVCDLTEPDPTKRWKMLYTATKVSDSKTRLMYATASTPLGTWTKQGTVIDVGAGGSDDEGAARECSIIRHNGQWEVWYAGWDASGVSSLRRATGNDFASLTKQGTVFKMPATGTAQNLTANLNTAPGRTVTVGSTTGYSVDATVIVSRGTTDQDYGYSRIRKIVSGTVLELYHGLTGFLTSSSPVARIKQVDSEPNISPRVIARVGSEWWFYMTWWEPFLNSTDAASYANLLEEMSLYKHSNADPVTLARSDVQLLASPVILRGAFLDSESLENMTIMNTPFAGDVGAGAAAGHPLLMRLGF